MSTGGSNPNEDPRQPGGDYSPPGAYPPPFDNGYPAAPPPAFDDRAGAPAQLTVGSAISYGWDRFRGNALVWILFVLAAAVIQGVLNLALRTDSWLISVLFGVVIGVVGLLMQAAAVRGALHEVDGARPKFGSFFQFPNAVAIVIAGLVIGVASSIGYVLLIIPGIAVTFFTWWAFQFIIDADQSAFAAITASAKAIASNGGTLFVLALALVGLNFVGALLLGIGLLVTIPITAIASTYAYRLTVGKPVAFR